MMPGEKKKKKKKKKRKKFASGDKIYAHTFKEVLEVYNAKQNKWTGETITFPAEFEDRYNCLITQSKDKIYIIGGRRQFHA